MRSDCPYNWNRETCSSETMNCCNMNRECLDKHLAGYLEWKRTANLLEDVNTVLDLTIKHDVETRQILFLNTLSTYGPNPQNSIIKGPTSIGKTHVATRIIELFPKDDLIVRGGSSPKSFFHQKDQHVSFDDDRKAWVFHLNRKHLCWLDMPGDRLLDNIKPLLSHDQPEIIHDITDKTGTGQTRTKKVILSGWPSVTFITTRLPTDPELANRCWLLSASDQPEKIRDALKLKTSQLTDEKAWLEALEANPLRRRVKQLILDIRNAAPVEIKRPDLNQFEIEFNKSFGTHQVPRLMRDYPRIIGLADAITLLYRYQREESPGVLKQTYEDIFKAFELSKPYLISMKYGVPPAVLEFYDRVLSPLRSQTIEGFKPALKDITRQYYLQYHQTIGIWNIERGYLKALEDAGIIHKEPSETDKRTSVYEILPLNLEALY